MSIEALLKSAEKYSFYGLFNHFHFFTFIHTTNSVLKLDIIYLCGSPFPPPAPVLAVLSQVPPTGIKPILHNFLEERVQSCPLTARGYEFRLHRRIHIAEEYIALLRKSDVKRAPIVVRMFSPVVALSVPRPDDEHRHAPSYVGDRRRQRVVVVVFLFGPAHADARQLLPVLAPDLLDPLLQVVERFTIGEIVHEHKSVRVGVENTSTVAMSARPTHLPELEEHVSTVTVVARVRVLEHLDTATDRRVRVVVRFLLHDAVDERAFTHTRIADHDQF